MIGQVLGQDLVKSITCLAQIVVKVCQRKYLHDWPVGIDKFIIRLIQITKKELL